MGSSAGSGLTALQREVLRGRFVLEEVARDLGATLQVRQDAPSCRR